MQRHRAPWTLIAFFGLSVLTAVAYWPGLYGGFLFDDFANLPNLGAMGPIDNWSAFWRYITSGIADPTGRPLTLLTFLLDARNWPTSPLPLKRTNLVLHLLNSGLLSLLLGKLGRLSFRKVPCWRLDLAALIGAGLWMLHPLLVSTTLYIVQREAMLPVTFTLLGLLAWLRGRETTLQAHNIRGLFWMATGLGICTVLGLLSKANGILLPALALVLEYTLLRATENPYQRVGSQWRRYTRLMLLMAWAPASLVAAYLFRQGWQGLLQPSSVLRPWTLGQRLLTEPRVLMNYLELLWLPRPFTPGLFNDQIKASVSLWVPATTLPAALAVLALTSGGWILRRRLPAFCTVVLFYFVGQLLESSTISLELYFEHRNYLPALLIFWPLALWLCGVPQLGKVIAQAESATPNEVGTHLWGRTDASSFVRSNAGLGIATVVLMGLALMTHARAELWGNTHDQALLWARLNPDSPRAQTLAAQQDMTDGRIKEAKLRLTAALAQHPDQVQLAFNLLDAECYLGRADAAAIDGTRTALSNTHDPGGLLVNWFAAKITELRLQPCSGLTLEVLGGLLDTALSNLNLASISGRQQDILHLQGLLALEAGEGARALSYFNFALDQDVNPSTALQQAAALAAANYPQLGLDHLDHFESERDAQRSAAWGMPRVHAWVLYRQHYWEKELAILRSQLTIDANSAIANTVEPQQTKSTTR